MTAEMTKEQAVEIAANSLYEELSSACFTSEAAAARYSEAHEILTGIRWRVERQGVEGHYNWQCFVEDDDE